MRRYCWKDNLSIVKCQTQSSLNNSVRSLCNLALQKQARTFQTTAQKSAESDGKDSEANFSDIPPSKLALNVLFSYGKYKVLCFLKY
jgi:hypothetical protein